MRIIEGAPRRRPLVMDNRTEKSKRSTISEVSSSESWNLRFHFNTLELMCLGDSDDVVECNKVCDRAVISTYEQIQASKYSQGKKNIIRS